MPKRTDIKTIMILGAGPIIIGQACEFDYSGAQACKALKEEGYRVVLVNSNPATIMTDPVMADATYIEPLNWKVLERIIAKEKPDAILPTMGGQTALNLAMDLNREGILEKYGVELENMDYVQIHPTSLYSEKPGRHFLISESARGEGAILLNSKGERFVNELLPRDKVSAAIHAEMEKEGTKHVWLSFAPVPAEDIENHFPNIYKTCLEAGYDIKKEPAPVVPAQHYFMGGIHVDRHSKTTMEHLYAIGETSCNGVHGKNRLASNSLLESLVFAEKAAQHIAGKEGLE